MKKIAIGIVAHVDSGKTTLSEGLLYQAGEIRKLGRAGEESCSIFGRNAALRAFRIENAEFSSRKSFEQDIHREVSGQDCRVCQYDFG